MFPSPLLTAAFRADRNQKKAHLNAPFLRLMLYCRPITNRTGTTPAQALGLAPRRYREEEVLAWREDWGRFPIAA